MKIIHDSKELTSAFKDAVLNNDCIQMAVFEFEPKTLSDICGLKKDDFLKLLQDKLVCMYATDWFIYDDETIEGATESIKDLPVHFIEAPSKHFHPKVFLFTNREKPEWKAIVSSANITYGLEHNIQSSVLLSQDDDNEERGLKSNLEDYFEYLKIVEKENAKKESKKERKLKTENLKHEFISSVSCFIDTVEPLLNENFTSNRQWLILKRFMNGESYTDIASDFGLTGERMRQLAQKGASRLNSSIRNVKKNEEGETFSRICAAYEDMLANEAYQVISCEPKCSKTVFFKTRLALLSKLRKTMLG